MASEGFRGMYSYDPDTAGYLGVSPTRAKKKKEEIQPKPLLGYSLATYQYHTPGSLPSFHVVDSCF